MKKFFLLSFLLSTLHGFGQDTTQIKNELLIDKLTNHITTATYTGTIVPRGTAQLEMDFVYISQPFEHSFYHKFREGSFPELKVRYGLIMDRLELRLGTRVGYSHYSAVTHDPEFPTSFRYKQWFSDFLTLGLKANLLKYHQNKGRLSLLAEAYLPVLRSAEAKGGFPLPTITIINSDQLNSWLSYNVNAGWIFPPYGENNSFSAFTIAANPIFTILKPLKAFAGINTSFESGSGYSLPILYSGGLIYTPVSNIQIRAACTLENHPRVGFTFLHNNLGFAWRFIPENNH